MTMTRQEGEKKKKSWWPWSKGKAKDPSGPGTPHKVSFGSFGRSPMVPQVPMVPTDLRRGNSRLGLDLPTRPTSLDINSTTPEIEAYLRRPDHDLWTTVPASGSAAWEDANAQSDYGEETSPTLTATRGRGFGSARASRQAKGANKKQISAAVSSPALRAVAELQGAMPQRSRESPGVGSATAFTTPLRLAKHDEIDNSPFLFSGTPNSPSPLADIGGHHRKKPISDEMQDLRSKCNLPPLRHRTEYERKHPNHNFDWYTANIKCRGKHDEATGENLKECKKCNNCGQPCCEYVSLRSCANIISGIEILGRIATEAVGKVRAIDDTLPAGLEEYETLLECSDCQQIFCPKCGGRCSHSLCSSLLCKRCLSSRTSCSLHATSFEPRLASGISSNTPQTPNTVSP